MKLKVIMTMTLALVFGALIAPGCTTTQRLYVNNGNGEAGPRARLDSVIQSKITGIEKNELSNDKVASP